MHNEELMSVWLSVRPSVCHSFNYVPISWEFYELWYWSFTL